ncbi:methyl-accepting chemotaxis protein, partial [Acinetobacter nosocomialis]|uniref:methyl-accepting chemotaxis protein n=3 Tax=Pseudomonadota TaxID=1224 RepID=UPI001D1895BF
ITEIGRQVTHSSRVADNAVAKAAETTEMVTSLAASAEKIGDVLRLISAIASQTNLLALNATIEAARAG